MKNLNPTLRFVLAWLVFLGLGYGLLSLLMPSVSYLIRLAVLVVVPIAYDVIFSAFWVRTGSDELSKWRSQNRSEK